MRSGGRSKGFPNAGEMIRRTEINIETRRIMVIRRRQASNRGWCDGCLAEVQMITPNQAAAIAGISSRAIYRWIETSKIHFTEDSSGLVLVCVASVGASQTQSDE